MLQGAEHGRLAGGPRALQTYLGFFKNGQAARAADLGDDWCGKALGEQQVAIIFEGGWLDPYMKTTYPDTKYAWARDAEGHEKATLGFTVSYSIGADSANKDAAWVLLQYLTGPEGMKTWTEGGVGILPPDVPPAPARTSSWRARLCSPVELRPRLQQDQ